MLRGIARLRGIEAINAFLDAAHVKHAATVTHICEHYLSDQASPATDD
jgi:hypothetical protein